MRVIKLTETSLIVTWLTSSHGVIKTVAKGARRPKSPFKGKLDLFYQSEICWTQAKSSELHTLREVASLNFRSTIRSSYANTELASYFCTLLERLIEPGMPAEGFLELLDRGLNYLGGSPANLKALHHFERETCKLLGIFTNERSAKSLLLSVLHGLPTNRERCISMLD